MTQLGGGQSLYLERGNILNLNLSAYHSSVEYWWRVRKVLHWLAVDMKGIFVWRLLSYRSWLGERHFHESILVIWQCSKAVSRNCNILLQVWQHLMLLWLNHIYILRILTLKVKINFSPGLSLWGPKHRRKRTTVYDLKIFCVLFYSPVIVIGLDCLAAVKYETKTETGQ